jgi:argininosuccinate synthase
MKTRFVLAYSEGWIRRLPLNGSSKNYDAEVVASARPGTEETGQVLISKREYRAVKAYVEDVQRSLSATSSSPAPGKRSMKSLSARPSIARPLIAKKQIEIGDQGWRKRRALAQPAKQRPGPRGD